MTYEVLIIDPPWPKRKGGLRSVRPNQTRNFDYETLSCNEIFALLDRDVFPQAAQTHCVFMWVIDSTLNETDDQMLARGYKRHCRFIWDKTNGVAPAMTVRFSHEYLVWYYKPKMLKIALEQRGKFTTVFREAAREHSRKPECSYAMISALYPTATKFDVFSRESRPGWDQYGDQKNHFDIPIMCGTI